MCFAAQAQFACSHISQSFVQDCLQAQASGTWCQIDPQLSTQIIRVQQVCPRCANEEQQQQSTVHDEDNESASESESENDDSEEADDDYDDDKGSDHEEHDRDNSTEDEYSTVLGSLPSVAASYSALRAGDVDVPTTVAEKSEATFRLSAPVQGAYRDHRSALGSTGAPNNQQQRHSPILQQQDQAQQQPPDAAFVPPRHGAQAFIHSPIADVPQMPAPNSSQYLNTRQQQQAFAPVHQENPRHDPRHASSRASKNGSQRHSRRNTLDQSHTNEFARLKAEARRLEEEQDDVNLHFALRLSIENEQDLQKGIALSIEDIDRQNIERAKRVSDEEATRDVKEARLQTLKDYIETLKRDNEARKRQGVTGTHSADEFHRDFDKGEGMGKGTRRAGTSTKSDKYGGSKVAGFSVLSSSKSTVRANSATRANIGSSQSAVGAGKESGSASEFNIPDSDNYSRSSTTQRPSAHPSGNVNAPPSPTLTLGTAARQLEEEERRRKRMFKAYQRD